MPLKLSVLCVSFKWNFVPSFGAWNYLWKKHWLHINSVFTIPTSLTRTETAVCVCMRNVLHLTEKSSTRPTDKIEADSECARCSLAFRWTIFTVQCTSRWSMEWQRLSVLDVNLFRSRLRLTAHALARGYGCAMNRTECRYVYGDFGHNNNGQCADKMTRAHNNGYASDTWRKKPKHKWAHEIRSCANDLYECVAK